MCQPSGRREPETDYSSPEATATRFFNSLFGNTRNWSQAYSCLSPDARKTFDSSRGLLSFADHWENRLSSFEEFVKERHNAFPYTHNTCFHVSKIQEEEFFGDHAVVSVELLENHLARDRLVIVQIKHLSKHGDDWLLTSGELEGNLDDIIGIRRPGGKGGS